ncbi:hypothetical protein K461DRAFT_279851 [Myriangium duriaei CBS 260.36]|uniref:Uncharacterized protein n=1 Tax=Myriangium duriaei CBS 260.36 TaxID=1168546 RepID=A0A9P4MKS7_9PEZI|nr:hypothetical protein K461DRAFT_279851 [Myriangium duriaei CBS 260.36]
MSLNPRTRTPAWRPYHAGMFIALGMFAVVPISAGLLAHGLVDMNERITLFPWLSFEFGCYLFGAILYAVSIRPTSTEITPVLTPPLDEIPRKARSRQL